MAEIKVGQKYRLLKLRDCWDNEGYKVGDIVEIRQTSPLNNLGLVQGIFGTGSSVIVLPAHSDDVELVDDSNQERKNPYIRTITNRHTGESIEADIYDVLAAYDVTCPCMAHGIKKAMVPGERHNKSVWKDKKEAAWSIEESILLQGDKEDEH